MATIEAIAIKRERATERIKTAAAGLAGKLDFDISQIELEPYDHDPLYRQMMQLESVADLLEGAAAKAGQAQGQPSQQESKTVLSTNTGNNSGKGNK